MADFILVHDAWHGAWVWQKVVELLEQAKESHGVGQVLAPDLPGHGRKSFDEIRRITQEHYLNAVVTPAQANRLADVVLVGHGFASTFLPQAALELGDSVKRVVFIAGMLPAEGRTAYSTLSLPQRILVRRLRPSEKGVTLPRLVFRRMLCNRLNGDLARELLSRLVPDPYLPWRVPASREGFAGRFPVTYVLLTGDRAIPPRTQRRYARSLDSPEVVEMAAGHEVLLSQPADIAELLLKYA